MSAYGDIERLLTSWLAQQLAVRVVTDLPANLDDVLPLVQVTRYGGGDDVISLDRPLVDVDCYAATRGAAYELAQRVRDAVRFALPGRVVDSVLVCRVDTLSGPVWRPYENATLRRFGASYQITTQRGTT